jgi:uncharacterized membrane protein
VSLIVSFALKASVKELAIVICKANVLQQVSCYQRVNSMADFVLGILLAIHIGSVIGWMGSSIFFTWAVIPSLDSLNSESKMNFLSDVMLRFSKFILVSSSTTIGAGIVLAGWVFSVNSPLLPTGAGFFSFLVSAVLAFVAFLVALTAIVAPANNLVQIFKRTKNVGSQMDPEDIAKVAQAEKMIRSGAKALSAILPFVMILMVLSPYV